MDQTSSYKHREQSPFDSLNGQTCDVGASTRASSLLALVSTERRIPGASNLLALNEAGARMAKKARPVQRPPHRTRNCWARRLRSAGKSICFIESARRAYIRDSRRSPDLAP